MGKHDLKINIGWDSKNDEFPESVIIESDRELEPEDIEAIIYKEFKEIPCSFDGYSPTDEDRKTIEYTLKGLS